MAASKLKPVDPRLQGETWKDCALRLATKLKFHSATYSEGGSGEYINNSRFE